MICYGLFQALSRLGPLSLGTQSPPHPDINGYGYDFYCALQPLTKSGHFIIMNMGHDSFSLFTCLCKFIYAKTKIMNTKI